MNKKRVSLGLGMAALTEPDRYAEVSFIGEDPAQPVSGEVSALIDFYGLIDMDKSVSDFALSGVPRWLPRLVGIVDLSSDKSIVKKFLGGNIETYTQSAVMGANGCPWRTFLAEYPLRLYSGRLFYGIIILYNRIKRSRAYEMACR